MKFGAATEDTEKELAKALAVREKPNQYEFSRFELSTSVFSVVNLGFSAFGRM